MISYTATTIEIKHTYFGQVELECSMASVITVRGTRKQCRNKRKYEGKFI